MWMAKTLVQAAYIKIKDNIITGKYEEGLRLTEARLVKDLNMSRTPIRNAISRLISEGFINHQSHCGITVAKTATSFEDITEFLEIRLLFLKHSIEKAIKKDNNFDTPGLKKYLEEYKAALEKEDVKTFYDALWKVHELLLIPAENKTMMNIMKHIQGKLLLGSVKHSYIKRKLYVHEQIGLIDNFITYLEENEYEKAFLTFEQITKEIIISLL